MANIRSDQQTFRIHRTVTLALQGILLLGIVLAIAERRWLAAAATTGIMLVTLIPVFVGRRYRLIVSPEFEVLAIVFVYASLFLGEVQGYYVRYWWWDALLHTGSGFLLGLLGFLLVHVLNEAERIDLHMKPGFVALFSFMFAVGIGALWEIFEFVMDQVFGLNMQKSGLVDTMWDLIVDTVGALAIALLGWRHLKNKASRSFIERWIESFVHANPQLFDPQRRDNDIERE